MPEIPAQYLLSPYAPEPRTLVDILYDTAARYPDAPAIDDGAVQLTYSELIADVEDSVAWLAARGHRPRRPGRGPDAVGHRRALRRDPGGAGGRRRLRPGRRRRPRRAGRAGLRRGRRRRRDHRAAAWSAAPARPAAGAPRRRRAATTPGSSSPPARPARPKGVAVTHRSAAAFVDAEARLFLQDDPLGPGDRVLAGLSVAFDASCEEMWLAWRHGACLVPGAAVAGAQRHGPRAVAGRRSGITVVSTVPTLAALWPAEALDERPAADLRRRGLPARARRAAGRRRAARCGTPTARPRPPSSPARARLDGDGPVRIGLPLDGWDLAVVDADGAAGRRWARSAS